MGEKGFQEFRKFREIGIREVGNVLGTMGIAIIHPEKILGIFELDTTPPFPILNVDK